MIQRKDAVNAKNIPMGSTLNFISSPGSILYKEYSITLPSRIVGSIDTTIENFRMEAPIVQNSLRFG